MNKNCQNCQKEFEITKEDFSFYKRIDVPAPTFCPECRLQRRLAWIIGVLLYKRKCDLCGIETLSMYEIDAPYKVYCHKCWWSDNWDARDYAMDYDFSKPFFEQWNNLLHQVPILGLSIDTITGKLSPYTNHCGNAKNCYMIFYSNHNEESAYSFYLTKNRFVFNCGLTAVCENCFELMHGYKNYNVIEGRHVRNSIDCAFLRDCDNCTNCFGSANLRNKSYMFFNKQLTKEEYNKKIKEIDLGSYKTYLAIKDKVKKHWKNYPPRSTWKDFCDSCTGNYIFQSKNCYECFEVSNAQDSKYLTMLKEGPIRDSYDYTDWGLNALRLYECSTVGENVTDVYFSNESGFNLLNIEYSKLQTGGTNCFGCVSIKKGSYFILNKQYTKEKYEKLIPKIKQQMMDIPYIDKKGRVYKYGEFFPIEFSPHPYNHTFANLFFPLTNKEILSEGFNYNLEEKKEYDIEINAKDLPDNIKDVSDSLIGKVIGCLKCYKGFKIIKMEIEFLRRMNLPLPRICPFCRIKEKVNHWTNIMKLFDRKCNRCNNLFKTFYTEKEYPTVWCLDCFKKEVF